MIHDKDVTDDDNVEFILKTLIKEGFHSCPVAATCTKDLSPKSFLKIIQNTSINKAPKKRSETAPGALWEPLWQQSRSDTLPEPIFSGFWKDPASP